MRPVGTVHGLALPRRKTGEMLAAFGPLLLRGLQLFCIDAGNSFNPTPLIEWLRGQREDQRPILDHHIFLSRAFTCHQLAGAAEALLAPLLEESIPTVAAILGVGEMFLDEDIRLAERRYLFERVLLRTEEIARRGLPVLLTCGQNRANPWTLKLAGRVDMLPDIHATLPALGRLLDGTHMAYV